MAKKETTAAAALEIIVSQYGIDTFRDRRRAFALLSDLAPGDANAKDRRRIRQALDSGAAEILLKAAESGTGGELHINESVSRLMERRTFRMTTEAAMTESALSMLCAAAAEKRKPPAGISKAQTSGKSSALSQLHLQRRELSAGSLRGFCCLPRFRNSG